MHGLLLGLLIALAMAVIFLLIPGLLGVERSPWTLRDVGSEVAGIVVVLLIASSLGAIVGDFIARKLRGL
jgi:hypothetical protein